MIKLDNEWSFKRDPYNWILYQTYESVDKKTGEVKLKTKQSYHRNIKGILNYLLDKGVGNLDNLSQVVELMDSTVKKCTDLVESFACEAD